MSHSQSVCSCFLDLLLVMFDSRCGALVWGCAVLLFSFLLLLLNQSTVLSKVDILVVFVDTCLSASFYLSSPQCQSVA